MLFIPRTILTYNKSINGLRTLIKISQPNFYPGKYTNISKSPHLIYVYSSILASYICLIQYNKFISPYNETAGNLKLLLSGTRIHRPMDTS